MSSKEVVSLLKEKLDGPQMEDCEYKLKWIDATKTTKRNLRFFFAITAVR